MINLTTLAFVMAFAAILIAVVNWRYLPVGTKSILVGAHAFWFHPYAVFRGWLNLYGFPFHPARWLCFIFHDIGYWGSPNMDGPEGEAHPERGARIVYWLTFRSQHWHDECLFHSRYYAKKAGGKPSKLCMADKLAPIYTPAWLYLWGTELSGELTEYMANGKKADPAKVGGPIATLLQSDEPRHWYLGLRKWMRIYVNNHKDGQEDTHTQVRHETSQN